MTLNQWKVLQRAMAMSNVTGRKASRYLCSNVNVIQMEIEKHEARLKIEFGVENFQKAQMIANIIGQNVDRNGQVSRETVEKIKVDYPADFAVYELYNESLSKIYNRPVEIKLMPIKERWLSRNIAMVDRYPIEGLIKLSKFNWPWM